MMPSDLWSNELKMKLKKKNKKKVSLSANKKSSVCALFAPTGYIARRKTTRDSGDLAVDKKSDAKLN
jgi:hypothetical protein